MRIYYQTSQAVPELQPTSSDVESQEGLDVTLGKVNQSIVWGGTRCYNDIVTVIFTKMVVTGCLGWNQSIQLQEATKLRAEGAVPL